MSVQRFIMKKLLIISFCLLSIGASAQEKAPMPPVPFNDPRDPKGAVLLDSPDIGIQVKYGLLDTAIKQYQIAQTKATEEQSTKVVSAELGALARMSRAALDLQGAISRQTEADWARAAVGEPSVTPKAVANILETCTQLLRERETSH